MYLKESDVWHVQNASPKNHQSAFPVFVWWSETEMSMRCKCISQGAIIYAQALFFKLKVPHMFNLQIYAAV